MSSKELKRAGLKVTLPRVKILEILASCTHSNCCHMSAESVHQQLADAGEEVGLATIYRVLTQFEEAGLVKRHNFDGGQSVFELDEGNHHDHIICLSCNRIDEFYDEAIHTQQLLAAKNLGYELTEHRMTLYGICAECQANISHIHPNSPVTPAALE